jgi:cytochrome c556
MMRETIVAVAVAVVLLAACAPPQKNIPTAEVPKLTKLDDVMDVQATVADPQFKKIGAASYGDADFAAFADTADRIAATSIKIKDFSKGPAFDALAVRLHDKAGALAQAAQAKDAAGARTALTEMKATCKECHSKFR